MVQTLIAKWTTSKFTQVSTGGRAIWQGNAQVCRYFPKSRKRENTVMLEVKLNPVSVPTVNYAASVGYARGIRDCYL